MRSSILYFAPIRHTFSFDGDARRRVSRRASRLLFLGFFASFAVKVPLVPFHTWLPDAHTEAPTAGSVMLAAVLLKMGAYGLIRFASRCSPTRRARLRPVDHGLAIIGIVYGRLVAIVQKDLKRLVAYSSVAHLGFVVLGMFAGTYQGMSGGVLQMVSHGLSTGALFMLVGMLYDRRTHADLPTSEGSQSVDPWPGIFLFVALASIGLPGLNGFVGEFLVLLGTFAGYRWWVDPGCLGVVLAAIYLLWAYQRVFHGPVTKGDEPVLPDVNLREVVMLAPIMAL